ncbi:RES family NAD+ phosphorylase [Spirosoma endbachense]|uniref:RES family NAD+ phosphorylase n=1 Tax=Spirosoma endbachense TaxID=2666025 RepID=UPI001E56EB5B|nr:RES family NAD+ phosphorylase [Spirosoma endbachense]
MESRLSGGRWNSKGVGVLYATSTPVLGLVETLAYAPAARHEDLPTYWVFSLKVPDNIRCDKQDGLPDYWQDKTYERTQTWLNDWLAALTNLELRYRTY